MTDNPFQNFIDSLNTDTGGEYTCEQVHPALRQAIEELPDPGLPEGAYGWKPMLPAVEQQLRTCLTTESLAGILEEYPTLMLTPELLVSLMIKIEIIITLAWLTRERVCEILAEGADG